MDTGEPAENTYIGNWLDGLVMDVRFAIRMMVRSPWFTLSVIATLALGIGSATAIFNVADEVVFSDLPYRNPDELVVLGFRAQAFSGFVPTVYDFEYKAYSRLPELFSEFGAFKDTYENMVVAGEPRGARIGHVSLNYFGILGIQPALGRLFTENEFLDGQQDVILISHETWINRFNGRASVLTETAVLGDRICQIAGVLPRSFQAPVGQSADVYHPLLIPESDGGVRLFFDLIGRLRKGVSLEQAQAAIDSMHFGLDPEKEAKWNERRHREIRDLKAHSRDRLATPYYAFLAAVGILYFIACTNAANLLMTRILGRHREFCIRMSLGIKRRRMMQMLLVEALMLSILASSLALLISFWLTPILFGLSPNKSPIDESFHGLTFHAATFSSAMCFATTILVSIIPLFLMSRIQPIDGLKQGGISSSDSSGVKFVRNIMVIFETALAVTLLSAAGLMVQSIWNLQAVDMGFDPTGCLGISLSRKLDSSEPPESKQVFIDQLDQRLKKLPNVLEVAFSSSIPYGGAIAGGFDRPDGTMFIYEAAAVTHNFLKTLGLKLEKGRWFEESEKIDADVVIVSQSFVKGYFQEEEIDPIGKSVERIGGKDKVWRIIGVVRDVREWPRGDPYPQVYFPHSQSGINHISVLLKVSNKEDPLLEKSIREAVYAVDPLVAIVKVNAIFDSVENRMKEEEYALLILKLLSALALVLSGLGLFSVMAYSVEKQRREICVRIALGAMPQDLFRMILRRGIVLCSIGLLAGILMSVFLSKYLRSLVYEVSPLDPVILAVVVGVLFMVSLLACWVPAQRASRVNAMDAIRNE